MSFYDIAFVFFAIIIIIIIVIVIIIGFFLPSNRLASRNELIR